MLFSILCAVSFLISVLVCVGTGAFNTLTFLWLLPSGFLGCFLLLVGLAFAWLLLYCRRIDPEQTWDEDTPWFRWLIMEYIHTILTVLPIHVKTRGMEKTPTQGRFLLVSNHLDNIDPAFFYFCFPKSQLAFIAKQETKKMFLVNKVMPKLLCPTINRENDREALKTILRCISMLKNDTVSIAVFPEGGINKHRKLAHFRPGVFKIAQKAKVPIVVCTIRNTNQVIKRLGKLKSSTVDVHLLDVLQPEDFAEKTTVELAEEIYAMMAADLGPENILTSAEEENT